MARLAVLSVLLLTLSSCASRTASTPPPEPPWNLTIYVRDPRGRMVSYAKVYFQEPPNPAIEVEATVFGRARAWITRPITVWAETQGFFPSTPRYFTEGEYIITLYPYAKADA